MPVFYLSTTHDTAVRCFIVQRHQPGFLHLATVPAPQDKDYTTLVKFMADPEKVAKDVKSDYWVAEGPAPPPPAWMPQDA